MPHTSYVFRSMHYSIMNSGLPHSEIPGSKLTYSSPRHIGVSPVLHRLLVPRHSPCALLHLINSLWEIIHFSMSLFKILLFSFQGTHYRRMRWLLRLSQDVTGFSRRTLLWWILRLSQDVTGFSRKAFP